jgi:endonuclease/exonuclease/phosphatase family metal-dependent hydrolase
MNLLFIRVLPNLFGSLVNEFFSKKPILIAMHFSKVKAFLMVWMLMTAALKAQSLKIMTYNIRLDVAIDKENDWAHRKDFFNSQIQFYEPEVFGVQEARTNQITDIANALPQYNYVGIGRDGIEKGEASSIFYKKERLKVIVSNTFWLSETPNIVSVGWDAAYNRICSYALFKDIKNNNFFWVFNTHLDHIGEESKSNSITLILSEIEKLNIKKYPVLLIGDFNSLPDSDRIVALKKVMNDSRDISQEKPFGPFGTFNDFKYNEPVTIQIDYVFISLNKKIKVKKYAVLSDSNAFRYPSDHFPVFVELLYH